MQKIKLWIIHCILLSSICISNSALGKVIVKTSGLDGELEENVTIYLNNLLTDEYANTPRFENQLKTAIKKGLRPFGYYTPIIKISERKQRDNIIKEINIKKGEPILYKEIDFNLLGAGAKKIEFLKIKQQALPKIGSRVEQLQYEKLKSLLEAAALENGYFQARFEKHKLAISPVNKQGFLTLYYNTGPQYNFGKLSIKGSQIEQQRLLSLFSFKEGEPYNATALAKLNHSLANTNWFSSIVVQGDFKQIKNYNLPIDVDVIAAKKNQIITGLGFATDSGMRLKLGWKKPWLNKNGDSFYTNIDYSMIESTFSLDYKLPLLNAAKNFYVFNGGYQSKDNTDIVSKKIKLSATRHWLLDSGWNRELGATWLQEKFTQGVQKEQSRDFLLPKIAFSRTRVKGGVFPNWGDRYTLSLQGGLKAALSDANFFSVQATTTWLRTFSQAHRNIATINLGAIEIDNILQLPPSLRFFAGGANSIRGYDFEAIAPLDAKGKVEGGKYSFVAKYEYQYRVKPKWWLATFIDSGSVWNSKPDWYSSIGIGLRWESPVGPVRIDCAWGLNDTVNEIGGLHLYIALGPEL